MRTHLKTYTVKSSKIKNPFRCVLITDLHNKDYGRTENPILSKIRALNPDIILCAGDLIVGKSDVPQDAALRLATALPKIAPTWFSNGNHETQLHIFEPEKYELIRGTMRNAGMHILNNEFEKICINGNRLYIHGLELGLSKYRKFVLQHISRRYLRERLGYMKDPDAFHILLAHNPEFGDLYCRWGADLIVSGHYHGGLVRSPITGRNMLSPYGFYYPKHGYGQTFWAENGRYIRNTSDRKPAGDSVPQGTCMITSAGLGDHRIPIRIFNPHELISIDIKEN